MNCRAEPRAGGCIVVDRAVRRPCRGFRGAVEFCHRWNCLLTRERLAAYRPPSFESEGGIRYYEKTVSTES